ncbi:hypothetical protein C0Q70_14209 [Pomacea canaliculata]|uniref:Uncharacterized protein n=2 Tax=Pomacea canaliculata TaxID=400727 RepID=A0A2T7NZC7_POMCA|nr:hypothetical protein C0Q70_14209 [Pomacea canaliculata]
MQQTKTTMTKEDSGSEISLNDDAADEDQSEKSGLANVMAKILSKSTPEKKSVILCRGKTDREIQKKKRSKGNEDSRSQMCQILMKVLVMIQKLGKKLP